jgi:hypothetical protein
MKHFILGVLAQQPDPPFHGFMVMGGMAIIFILALINNNNKSKAKAKRLAQEQSELKARQDRELAEQKTIRDQADAKRRLEKHQAEQEHIRNTLVKLEADKCEAVEILPSSISKAEAALDLAVFEFSEGAFNPFWDAIEKTITCLVSYEKGIQTIDATSKRIPEELGKLDSPPPYFVSPKISLPKADKAIARMRQIVRKADKNIDFATIYQQRRTNGILVAGFANLGTAIADMGSRIQGSVDGLTQTLNSSIAAMSKQDAEYYKESISSMEAMREQLVSDAEARREHEAKDEEMQDNMQRRRMPINKDFSDGKYPQ